MIVHHRVDAIEPQGQLLFERRLAPILARMCPDRLFWVIRVGSRPVLVRRLKANDQTLSILISASEGCQGGSHVADPARSHRSTIARNTAPLEPAFSLGADLIQI